MPQISYAHEVFRKLIHLSSLWMVVAIGTLSQSTTLFLFGTLLILQIFLEYGYFRRWQPFVLFSGWLFEKTLRDKERSTQFRLSGAPWVLGAAWMVSLLFAPIVAMTALSIMLISDTAAALIGRKWGRHPLNQGRKSLEGSAAFWICAAAVLLGFQYGYHMPWCFGLYGLIGVTLAMLAEIYEPQLHVDDNISIPLIIGLCLSPSGNAWSPLLIQFFSAG